MSLREKIEVQNNRKNFSQEVHQAILDELQQRTEKGLALEESALSFQYLQNAVLYKTRSDKSWVQSEDLNVPVVNEALYPAEIAWLHRIEKNFEYSAAAETWFSGARRSLVKELRKEKYPALSTEWPKLSHEQRKDVLTSIVHRNIQKLAGDEFSFILPEIVIDEDPGAPVAYAAGNGRIGISRGLLEDDECFYPLGPALHESVHNALSQLGAKVEDGSLPENHPLYRDAEVKSIRQKLNSAASSEIESVYFGDPEEKLAYSQQGRFNFGLYRNDTLSEVFKQYAFDAEHYLELKAPRAAAIMKNMGFFPA